MNIETYKTNVKSKKDAILIVALLQFVISDCIIEFELKGREKMFRIETNRDIKEMVHGVFTKQGFECQKI
ncbi:hypothetical protein [Flavobacterium hercynium]|uniref:Uncharacterized protein n=1 Tax=Flavobacterium hercynium TaxID=387094 RepID=A0A226GRV8_9FLAO|nr:hypothetical protein [Flavobacterium hercynium]OXA84090.1 hypothetical protein B0A66_21335 [Flavobacterium hercynium]SMP20825.1 hypothetical protein SAMN06265346_106246 [Flavobacterium hercynium]